MEEAGAALNACLLAESQSEKVLDHTVPLRYLIERHRFASSKR